MNQTYNTENNHLHGKVTAKYNKYVRVSGEQIDILATASTKLLEKKDIATGDIVVVEMLDGIQENGELPRGVVRSVEPRTSAFSRKVAGKETKEQIIAANVDFIFIIIGLDDNFRISRIERYLTAAWESGAQPVIVLNKSDLLSPDETAVKIIEVEEIAFGVEVVATSSVTGEGLERLQAILLPDKTGVFVGSSGVGKSSLINLLTGEERQKVTETRKQDGKGRHTTTLSVYLPLPEGGGIIDTPGMRELQVWSSAESLGSAFEDIEELARRCKFSDCKHQSEPGCAVQNAIKRGDLSIERIQNYRKLQKEIAYLERRKDDNWQRLERERGKEFSKYARKHLQQKKRDRKH